MNVIHPEGGNTLGVAKATVAHEIAHLCLNHKLICDNNTYETQEKEAWQLMQKWGFEKELKQHEQFNKNKGNLILQFAIRNSLRRL